MIVTDGTIREISIPNVYLFIFLYTATALAKIILIKTERRSKTLAKTNGHYLQPFCFLAHQKSKHMSCHFFTCVWKAQCSYKFSTRTIFHCLRSRKCTQLQTRTINLFPTPLKLVTNWVRTSTGKTCGMSKEIKSRTQLKPIAW